MNEKMMRTQGIEGQAAPELRVENWVDGNGNTLALAPSIDPRKEEITVIYCFQAWCPGCHKVGLPSLQRMVNQTTDLYKVQFLAIQTVFEGHEANTFERMLEVQKEYELKIPFGHDPGDESSGMISKTMTDYLTGGTPWFIMISEDGKVIFNDFHLNTDSAISFLNGQSENAQEKG